MDVWEILELAAIAYAIIGEMRSRSEVAELRGKVEGLYTLVAGIENPEQPDLTDLRVDTAKNALEIRVIKERMKEDAE